MNLRSVESEIITAHAMCDIDKIRGIYVELYSTKTKLDRWFDKYLDMFNDKLENCDRDDPVKKLYNSKFDEYSKVSRVIKVAENYMKQKAIA